MKVLPKSPSDINLSDAEVDRIVKMKIGGRGIMSKERAKAFGIPWPLEKGWKRALIWAVANNATKAAEDRIRTRELDRTQKNYQAAVKAAQPKAHKPKGKDKFYSSWEWKQVRFEAIKINGNRCQCCGWQPNDTKFGWLVVDHIKPRRKYPHLELDVSNLQVLCNACNQGKSNIYTDDFRAAEDHMRAIMWS